MHELRAYLRKQAQPPLLAELPAHPQLGLAVVIPCRDEPDVRTTLESLRRCRPPRAAVEVLLVWNASEADDAALRLRNRQGVNRALAWARQRQDPRFRVHVLNFPRLPARHAGVGLARKIGMDAALARFLAAGNANGIIASLDADCTCDDNYLLSLEAHFQRHPASSACTLYFEHALHGPLVDELYQAITRYELFLRYYRQGLRYARFPFAHFAVGSCLAVRCRSYARHGGMNRRKAGEDFYFLNKLIAAGRVSENTVTRVLPGVRASARAPFGTGRALRGWLAGERALSSTYDPRVFRDLAALVASVDGCYAMAPGEWRASAALSPRMRDFLLAQDVVARHAQIRANSASAHSFRKRFFQWFDGFRALKFIHFASDHAYPRVPLEQACRTLMRWQGLGDALSGADARSLLLYLRARDRGAPPSSPGCRGAPPDTILDRRPAPFRLPGALQSGAS